MEHIVEGRWGAGEGDGSCRHQQEGLGGWGKEEDPSSGGEAAGMAGRSSRGVLVQTLERKQKQASLTTERQMPSEPHWVLSTLHR